VPQLSIIVFSTREEFQTRIETELEASGHARVAALVSQRDRLGETVRAQRPDVVLADLGPEPSSVLDLLDTLDEPRPILLVAGPQGDSQLLLRALKAGAREFFPPEPTGDALRDAIERLVQECEPAPGAAQLGSVLAVVGANGGVGTTAVACQLAAALQELGGRAVVVDLDLSMGDVAVHFDVPVKYTMADAAREFQLDTVSLRSVLRAHRSGVQVLAAPREAEEGDLVRGQHVERVLELLRERFDWVIVDVASGCSESGMRALQLAQDVLLLTLLDVPSLNHARRHLELLRRLGQSDARIHPIVNRCSASGPLSEDDLVRFMGREHEARIPNDYPTIARCVNQGKTLGELAPGSAIHMAFRELARAVYAWSGAELPEPIDSRDLRTRVRHRLAHELRRRRSARPVRSDAQVTRPFRVVTVTGTKGGVGRTTVANNLAVYLRTLREDMPTLVLGLDDKLMADRMFAYHARTPEETVARAWRTGSFAAAIRPGQHGVHYVPSSSDIAELKREITDPYDLDRVLRETGWRGLVIIDTKADFEILTRNAITASDLTLVLVQDLVSLAEAQRLYQLLDEIARPRDRARVLLTQVDRRARLQDGKHRELRDLLVCETRRRGYPLLESFISRSPKVESLQSNAEGRAIPILQGAEGSLVHSQMSELAKEVLGLLDVAGLDERGADRSTPAPVERRERLVELARRHWRVPSWLAR
jgi:Flp pilus assembly CpaE family ATPase